MHLPLKPLLACVACGERQIPSLENQASLSWTLSARSSQRQVSPENPSSTSDALVPPALLGKWQLKARGSREM